MKDMRIAAALDFAELRMIRKLIERNRDELECDEPLFHGVTVVNRQQRVLLL